MLALVNLAVCGILVSDLSQSALLNSVEFFELIGRRLKRGGVFCLYSNGTAEQAFAIRETADRVFPFRETFFGGYLVILSNDPIPISEASIDQKLRRDDPFWIEIRNWHDTSSGAQVMQLVDRPHLAAADSHLMITDDHPIVEYPEYLSLQIRAADYNVQLPTPLHNPSE